MTTKTFEIQGLFGALDHLAIAKKLQWFPGVSSVEVNAASTTASVTYNESTTTPKHIMHAIKECGFHCTGMALPTHLCTPETPAGTPPAVTKHAHTDHAARKLDPHAGHAAHGGIVSVSEGRDLHADMGHGATGGR